MAQQSPYLYTYDGEQRPFDPGEEGCKIVHQREDRFVAVMTRMDGETMVFSQTGTTMHFALNRTGEELCPDGMVRELPEDGSLQLHHHSTVIKMLCDLYHLRVESEDQRSITLVPNV